MLQPDLTYQLLRNLTSPVVAVTAERRGKENGMISDAAVRASIVPSVPRLSVYIHKFNYSHDMIFETGRFGLHLLHEAVRHRPPARILQRTRSEQARVNPTSP